MQAEQEEYQQEGIKWTPIEFFNNKVRRRKTKEGRKEGGKKRSNKKEKRMNTGLKEEEGGF